MIDLVIIHDPDRLARNLSHQLLLTEESEHAGVNLEFVNFEWKDTPEGKLFYSLRGAIAEYEKEKIKERTGRGKRQKALQGGIVSVPHAYGYEWDKSTKTLRVVDEEASIVRRIFDLYVNRGEGSEGICRFLSSEGIRPKRSSCWRRSTILRILRNEIYCGVLYQNRWDTENGKASYPSERPRDEWIPVPVPPIVSREIWEAAQRTTAANRADHSYNVRHDCLLSGLLYCWCGSQMTAGQASGERIRYYACQRKFPWGHTVGTVSESFSRCPSRYVRQDRADQLVWSRLAEKISNPDIFVAELRGRRFFVVKWLEEDKMAPKKQRRTARRVYDRLVKEYGFRGGQSTIRRLVREIRPKNAAYIPLEFDPGEAVQVDWGEATVIIKGEKCKAHLFCMRLCYSGAGFVTVFPTEREHAFLEGHKQAFEFFGGVARRAIYDNLSTARKKGWGKHVSEEQGQFRLFRAHYAFKAEYCNPGEPHEKGLVEGLVGLARRNTLVPVPRADSWEEIQALLRERCMEYLSHRAHGGDRTVGEMLKDEIAQLIPLPKKPLDPAEQVEREVRPDGMVSFDRNWYSASPEFVGKVVTVKGTATKVRVLHRGEELAVHERHYTQGKKYYSGYAQYLRLLETRPRAVRNAAPVRHSRLPRGLFAYCYQSERDYSDMAMVRLLKLIEARGRETVYAAVHDALMAGERGIEAVLSRLGETPERKVTEPGEVLVKAVNLGEYDHLLQGGGVA